MYLECRFTLWPTSSFPLFAGLKLPKKPCLCRDFWIREYQVDFVRKELAPTYFTYPQRQTALKLRKVAASAFAVCSSFLLNFA